MIKYEKLAEQYGVCCDHYIRLDKYVGQHVQYNELGYPSISISDKTNIRKFIIDYRNETKLFLRMEEEYSKQLFKLHEEEVRFCRSQLIEGYMKERIESMEKLFEL